MILGDRNRKLLIFKDKVSILRTYTTISYDEDYKKEYLKKVFIMPRCYGEKLYDYAGNRITSVLTKDSKEFKVGSIADYFKENKEFFFLRKLKDSLSLVNSKIENLLEFKSPYYYFNSHLYYLDDLKLFKFSFLTLEKTEIMTLSRRPLIFCVSDDFVAFNDSSNKIHIYQGNSYKMYHWMSNKILTLAQNDDYVVAVSKSGDVAQFHSKLQKIEPLFKFDGEFLDLKIQNSKIYFLSNIEFRVFDLMTNTVVYSEFPICTSYFHTSYLSKYIDIQDSDLFKLKKKSTVEILNQLNKNIENPIVCITYSLGSNIFAFDSKEQNMISVFRSDEEINFVSSSHVFALDQRKSMCIIKIYDFYLDKLILNTTLSVSTKYNFKPKDFYFISNKLYVYIDKEIYILNRINVLEFVVKVRHKSYIKSGGNYLYIADEKGIFNLDTLKYAVKQKNITKFCIFKSRLIFYIENMGIYFDFPDRVQILDVRNVMDLYFDPSREGGVLCVLYNDLTGNFKFAKYRGFENFDPEKLDDSKCCPEVKLELISEVEVENAACFILSMEALSTRINQLLI